MDAAQLYREACALIDGLILLGDQPDRLLDATDRNRLERALLLFDQVIHVRPDNWAALWLMGKAHQRLGAFEAGLECFAAAHRIKPNQPDVAREAAIAAMDSDQPERAVAFCKAAIAAKPADAGLRANLAMALLFSGQPAEAVNRATDALDRDPADPITMRVAAVAREVLAGTRPCPRHVRDLEGPQDSETVKVS